MSERRQLSSSTALFFMTTAKPPKVGTERLLRGERHAARTAHRVGWCCLSGRKSSLVAGVVGCRVWTMRKIILSLASSNTRKECDVNLKRCCYAACPSSSPYKIGRYISNQRGDRWICYVFDRHAIHPGRSSVTRLRLSKYISSESVRALLWSVQGARLAGIARLYRAPPCRARKYSAPKPRGITVSAHTYYAHCFFFFS